jgi:hypothetical protein
MRSSAAPRSASARSRTIACAKVVSCTPGNSMCTPSLFSVSPRRACGRSITYASTRSPVVSSGRSGTRMDASARTYARTTSHKNLLSNARTASPGANRRSMSTKSGRTAPCALPQASRAQPPELAHTRRHPQTPSMRPLCRTCARCRAPSAPTSASTRRACGCCRKARHNVQARLEAQPW